MPGPLVRPSPGDAVRIAMTKWGPSPHWENDATFLGSDEHGDWVGWRAGEPMSRPGLAVEAGNDMVLLAPVGRGGAWMATFHRPVLDVHTYVDITTVPTWERWTDGRPALAAVDLDLDVIRAGTGDVWIDDEDEFAEHQVELGYPDRIVRLAEKSCALVLADVLAELAPYDGATAAGWFAVLDRFSR